MPAFSLGELTEATGGVLLRGDPEDRASSFSIDTRALSPGGVFFALRGGRSDGHDFLPAAARAGALCAVVEREPDVHAETPPAVLRVESTVAALGRAGAAARKRAGLRVVAVTGSAGKTTTKELIAAGLSVNRRVHRTKGNLNNLLGVPLTLLACPEDAEFAVVEMGMSAPGEIAALSRMADPDIALVTNVRPVHLEFFRSLDDIAAAKGELYGTIRPGAVAVVNLDDEACRIQAARHAGPRITFGRDPSADLVLEAIEDRFVPGAGLTFRRGPRTTRLSLRIGGAHAASDALSALASVAAAGEDVEAATAAMAAVEPSPGRGRVHRLEGDGILVDDSYNSNPEALASVLRTVGSSSPTGRKVLVLGDMLELGRDETDLHREAGERASAAGIQVLIGVGPRAKAAVEAARRARIAEVWHEPDAASAARSVPARIGPGDLVVVKGSRGIHLEQVVEALIRARGEAA